VTFEEEKYSLFSKPHKFTANFQ